MERRTDEAMRGSDGWVELLGRMCLVPTLGAVMAICGPGCTSKDPAQEVREDHDLDTKEEVPVQVEETTPEPQIEALTDVDDEDEVIAEKEEPETVTRSAEEVEKARAQAIGRKLDSVVTLDGKEYKDVTLRRIDNIGVSLLHADGVARVGFDKLDQKWRDEFAFSPEDAEARREMEKEQQAERQSGRLGLAEKRKQAAESRRKRTRDAEIAKLQKLVRARRSNIDKNMQVIDRLSTGLERKRASQPEEWEGDEQEVESTPASRKIADLVLRNKELKMQIQEAQARIQELQVQ